jgi:hypothetical protein
LGFGTGSSPTTFCSALFLWRVTSTLFCLFESQFFAWIIYEFNNCKFSVIASPVSELENACVATGTILVPLTQFVEQTFQCRDACGSGRTHLSTLSTECRMLHITGMEKPGRLASEM